MDALKFTFAFLAIVVPFSISSLKDKSMWIWVAFWVGPIVCGFGITEAIAAFKLTGFWIALLIGCCGFLMTGWYYLISRLAPKKTISRVFWEFKQKHPVYAAFNILGMIIFWAYLCMHLWFRW